MIQNCFNYVELNIGIILMVPEWNFDYKAIS